MTTYFAGLDLHKRYLTVCVLDSAGQVIREQRRLPSTLEAVTVQLPSPAAAVTVVLEATLQWAWFHERLTALGYRVLVAHPPPLKLISQARCKTDPIDARKLAELGRVGVVPAIWVPDAATRERRLRWRSRARLVRWRTRLKNRIHALLAEQNQAAPGTDLFGAGGRTWLAAVAVPTPVRAEITVALELIAHLDAHGGTGPAGSGWLKWILIEAVPTLKRRPGPVQAHYERLLRAKGKPKATVAAARKLGCSLYWMWRNGWSYDEWLQHEMARTGCPVHRLASPVRVAS